jgi:hypothetical protein
MSKQIRDDKVGEMNILGMFSPENCKRTGHFGNIIVDCGIILKCILRIKLRGYILSMYVCMYE